MSTLSLLREAFRSRNNPEDWDIVAHIIWRAGLVLAMLIAFVGIGFGIWNLLLALGVREAPPIVTDVPETVSREQLDAVLEQFEERRSLFNERQLAPPAITDQTE